MKIWGVVCLLGLMSGLNARVIDVADREEKSDVNMTLRLEDGGAAKEPLEDKTDLSSTLKTIGEDLTASQQDKEPPAFLIIDKTGMLSPPGGGVRSLDPKNASAIILPLFPEVEAPWWQTWWDEAMTWLFGEDS